MSNCLNRILGILLSVLMAFSMPIAAFAEPAAVDSSSEIVGSDGDDSPELGKDDWGSSTSSEGWNSESFDDSTSDSGMQLGSSYEGESNEVFSEGQEDEGLTGAPNLGPQVDRVLEDGVYTIASSFDPSMVLDISGASKDDGANVQLYASNGTAAQKFRITYGEDGYYTITCLASGKALDVEGASDVSGANVQQWRENGSDAQKWSIVQNDDGSYSFISKCNGFALDIQGGVTASGTNIQSWEVNKTHAQSFELNSSKSERLIADGIYTIESSLNPSYVLDVSGGSFSDCAAIQLYRSNRTDAQRFKFTYEDATGLYVIRNVKSGKVLDAANGRSENGTTLWQYADNSSTAQRWIVEGNAGGYTIHSAIDPAYVIDLSTGLVCNGGKIQLYRDNRTLAQSWIIRELDSIVVEGGRSVADGVYQIAPSSNLAIAFDVVGGSASDGANIQMYSANGTAAQKFKVVMDEDGFYTIQCVGSGKVLDVAGGSFSVGANAQQWTSNGSDAQKWVIKEASDGSYEIVSKLSGLSVDIASGNLRSGANVQLWDSNGTAAQRFSFISCVAEKTVEDGEYVLASCLDSSKVADVRNGSMAACAPLQLWSANGTDAQRFRFEYDSSTGFYTITSVKSGKVLDAAGGSCVNGTSVQQYNPNGTIAQRWIVKAVRDGYVICSAKDPGQVIDVSAASKENGAKIQLYSSNGSNAQVWSLGSVSAAVEFVANCKGNQLNAINRSASDVYVTLPSSTEVSGIDLRITKMPYDSVSFGSVSGLCNGDSVSLKDIMDDFDGLNEASFDVTLPSGELVETVHVLRSNDTCSLFLSSNDPVNKGRYYIEANPDHSASIEGSLVMLNENGDVVYDGALSQIKGRGNSTWAAEKKPYQIKLAKKADLLETGKKANKNKTWVLLANAFDNSSSRNVIAYSIAQQLGVRSSVEFKIVDLYFDGSYRGTYTLCEKVQINSGRVDIDNLEDENDAANSGSIEPNMTVGANSYGNPMRYATNLKNPQDITGGYLIELDARYAQEASYFSVSTKQGLLYFVCKSPEFWTYEEANYLSCMVQDAFDAMANGGINPRTGLKTSDYVDIDSFATLYWVNEITKNRDGLTFSSTYLFKDSDKNGKAKLTFGPAWDFDLSLGNLSTAAGAPTEVMKHPEGWYTAKYGIAPLLLADSSVAGVVNGIKGDVLSSCDAYVKGDFESQSKVIESSLKMNSIVWGANKENPQAIADWLTKRIQWLSGANL